MEWAIISLHFGGHLLTKVVHSVHLIHNAALREGHFSSARVFWRDFGRLA